MPQPTPVFTARSRSGIEALATAEANGKALEAVGRRTRFGFGMLLGVFSGFYMLTDLYRTDPVVRAALDRAGVPGYLLVVLLIGGVIGLVAARWGVRAWYWADELWTLIRPSR